MHLYISTLNYSQVPSNTDESISTFSDFLVLHQLTLHYSSMLCALAAISKGMPAVKVCSDKISLS